MNRKEKKEKYSFHEFNLFTTIDKIQLMYKKLYDEIYNRFNLKDDINQGKIFTIILVFLLILVGIITIFLIFNSLIGINLIFSLFKYTFIFLKEVYKIIKTKGSLILKYLHTKFDYSYENKQELDKVEVLELEKEGHLKETNFSHYNQCVLEFIDYLSSNIDYFNLDNKTKEKIIEMMQEVTLDLAYKEREATTKKLQEILGSLLTEVDLTDIYERREVDCEDTSCLDNGLAYVKKIDNIKNL